jgi:hypothetical protein
VDPQELIENFDAIAEIHEIKRIVRACSAASSSRSNARRKRANRARSIRPTAEQLNPSSTERITHVMIDYPPLFGRTLGKNNKQIS